MNKKLPITCSIILICFISSIPLISAETTSVTDHTIEIIEYDNAYQITEQIIFNYSIEGNYTFFTFYLPSSSTDITVVIDKNQQAIYEKNNDIYNINLSSFNLTNALIPIEIGYYIPSTTVFFEKRFLYDTSKLIINFENSELYKGSFHLKDNDLQIKLTKSITPESFNLYTIILIILLIIIILVTLWYAFVKRKNGKGRNRSYETSEQLEIEKSLLLEVLKEIEKMHRNQKISDESYNKLKGYYKQQTVDIMSALDQSTKK